MSTSKTPCDRLHECETKIRLTQEDDDLVTAYAKRRRYKKAAFVRRLVQIGLDALLNESDLIDRKTEVRG